MKKIVLTFLSVASFSIYNNIEARDYYDGGSIGFSNLSSQRGTGVALNGFLGNKLNKYLSIEANATYFFSGDYTAGDYSYNRYVKTADISEFFLGGAARGDLALTNRLGLYGKVGMGYTYASLTSVNGYDTKFMGYNDQDTAWFPTTLVGAGVQYELTKNLNVSFEDMNYISSVGGNLLSMGLNFSF